MRSSTPGTYPTGVKISDQQIKAVPLARHQFHSEWNYTVHSGPNPEAQVNKTSDMKSTK
jgi:hypothetical protein